MAGIGTTPSRSVVAKDIRNLQNWTHHDRRGLCGRIVLGLILLGHQRREAIQWAHDRADGVGGNARIQRRRFKLGMSERTRVIMHLLLNAYASPNDGRPAI